MCRKSIFNSDTGVIGKALGMRQSCQPLVSSEILQGSAAGFASHKSPVRDVSLMEV
jgi:hypothetical protein